MGDFVLGDLLCVLRDHRVGEIDLAATDHSTLGAGSGEHVIGQARAGSGKGIELRLEIFEVQREIEDVGIRRCRRLPIGKRGVAEEQSSRYGGGAGESTKKFASFAPPFDASVEGFDQVRRVRHDWSPDWPPVCAGCSYIKPAFALCSSAAVPNRPRWVPHSPELQISQRIQVFYSIGVMGEGRYREGLHRTGEPHRAETPLLILEKASELDQLRYRSPRYDSPVRRVLHPRS